MSKNSEAVKRWRQNTKRKLILAMGNKCIICGYNKCDDVLSFHHVIPGEKDVQWSSIRANIKSFKFILKEMKKCVLLCSNCHGELHSSRSETKLPQHYETLTDETIEALADGTSSLIPKTPCPICKTLKPEWFMTCSRKCGYTLAAGRKIDWSKYDAIEMFKTLSSDKIAEIIGCSSGAVMIRVKKLDPEGKIWKPAKQSRMTRK